MTSQLDSAAPGTESSLMAGTKTDLTAVGEGRGTVLGLKLDKMADSVTGQTTVDPKGYERALDQHPIWGRIWRRSSPVFSLYTDHNFRCGVNRDPGN
jgi:hypothetical protein